MLEIHNKGISAPPTSVPPSSPTNLNQLFINSLTEQQRQLFYKVLKAQFNKLLPLSAFTSSPPALSLYWMVEAVRKRHNLRSTQLSFLTLMYYATNQGKQYTTINNLLPYSPDSLSFILNNMRYYYKHNYIIRSKRTIKLTPEGLNLIRSMHQELREMIYTTNIQP